MGSCDDSASVARQWEMFKVAFATKQSALVFHLRNHYALIFAWREWYDCVVDNLPRQEAAQFPKVRRQILTARKGQQPSAWLDFDEVREIIISKEAYKVMHVSLTEHKRPAETIIPDEDVSDEEDGASVVMAS